MLDSRLPMLIAVVALSATSLTAHAAGDKPRDAEFSKANQLLFLEDHITAPDQTMVYRYDLDKTANMDDESGFHDEITMTARPTGKDGAKTVKLDYLSGDRGKFVRTVEQARGNPIIMVFLQRDVSEMDRLTGGHWRYFQKKIKLGLENSARVEQVKITYNGKQVQARRITLKPFTDETRKAMRDYSDKLYQFTLSEAVPGEVYAMRSVVPAEKKGAQPLIEERLVLKSAQALETSASAE